MLKGTEMPKIKKNYISEVKHLGKLKKIKLIESEAFGGARERFMAGKQNEASHDINLRDEQIIHMVQNLFFNIFEKNKATEKNTQEFLVEFQDFYRLWNSNAIPSQIKNALEQNIKITRNEYSGTKAVIEFQEGDFDLSDNNIFFREIHNPIKTLCLISLFPDLSNQITSILPNYNDEDYRNNISNVMYRYVDPKRFGKVKFINLGDCVGVNDSEVLKSYQNFRH